MHTYILYCYIILTDNEYSAKRPTGFIINFSIIAYIAFGVHHKPILSALKGIEYTHT